MRRTNYQSNASCGTSDETNFDRVSGLFGRKSSRKYSLGRYDVKEVRDYVFIDALRKWAQLQEKGE